MTNPFETKKKERMWGRQRTEKKLNQIIAERKKEKDGKVRENNDKLFDILEWYQEQ